jgi:hypothetical protein
MRHPAPENAVRIEPTLLAGVIRRAERREERLVHAALAPGERAALDTTEHFRVAEERERAEEVPAGSPPRARSISRWTSPAMNPYT